ncbi:MAG: PilZ domain-containing protein [Xanthobacteraceae bacterium]
MGERRHSIRKKSFLRGRVLFNKGRSAFDCLIRDISGDGARIIFSDTVSMPDVVDLYIPQKEQTLRARVQWRHGDEIGLAFPEASAAVDGAADGELAARVARLESELAALRRMLNRLKKDIASDDVDAA